MASNWFELQRNLSYCNYYKQHGDSGCYNCKNKECKHNKTIEVDKKENNNK